MTDIGPIRIVTLDKDAQLAQSPSDSTAWLIIQARSNANDERAYVVVPMPCKEDFTPEIARLDFCNAFDTLEYLIEHPEIREI